MWRIVHSIWQIYVSYSNTLMHSSIVISRKCATINWVTKCFHRVDNVFLFDWWSFAGLFFKKCDPLLLKPESQRGWTIVVLAVPHLNIPSFLASWNIYFWRNDAKSKSIVLNADKNLNCYDRFAATKIIGSLQVYLKFWSWWLVRHFERSQLFYLNRDGHKGRV